MEQKSNTGIRRFICILAAFFVAWWIFINVILRDPTHNGLNNQLFAAIYGVVSLLGGCVGLAASRRWGGRKSLIGKALLFFSIGLFAQEFGQLAYSFYIYALKVDIPYPSVGDIGYFGSVIFYILAVSHLAGASGFRFSIKNTSRKVIAFVIPALLLFISYFYFLRGYEYDFSSLSSIVRVLLDFGYPLGQAVYIAIALVSYLLSKKLLGGVMRKKILLILFALLIQYMADSSFLYAAKYSKYFAGGANDLLYLLAYTALALGLSTFLTLGVTGKTENAAPVNQPLSTGV